MTRHNRLRRLELLEDRTVPDWGLDPTFGTGGRATAFTPPDPDPQAGTITRFDPQDVTVQPDGKILIVGEASVQDVGPTFGVIRLNPDGTRDATFDGDGIAAYQIAEAGLRTFAGARAVFIQPDGKILVAGVVLDDSDTLPLLTAYDRRFGVVRLNADGSVDATFDGDGWQTVAVTQPGAYAGSTWLNVLAVGPDGRIILAGKAGTPPTGSQFAVVRLNSEGSVDTTFDGDGKQYVQFGQSGADDAATAVSVQPDGKIVLGVDIYSQGWVAGLARLNLDGSLDPTFGQGGLVLVVYTASGGAQERLTDLGVLPDGRITAVGTNQQGDLISVGVARLNPDGSIDPTMAGTGWLTVPLDTEADVMFGTVRQDGSVLVAGRAYHVLSETVVPIPGFGVRVFRTYSPTMFKVTRMTPDGTLDTSSIFGDSLYSPFVSGEMAVQADGKLLIVHQTQQSIEVLRLTDEPVVLPPPVTPPPPPPPPPPPLPPPPQPLRAADLDGDGTDDTISTDGPRLTVTSGADGSVLIDGFAPYEASFTGGITALLVDLDGDGRAEVITAPKLGGAARIQVLAFDDSTLVQRDNFFVFPDDGNYRGGASVAVGDVNGDGRPDLIVGAGAGGGPRVAVLDGRGLLGNAADPARLVADFFAFDAPGFRGGVNVVTSDLDLDERADVVAGAGAGGAPRVAVYGGGDLTAGGDVVPLYDGFYGTDVSSRDGIDLAAALAAGWELILGATEAGGLELRLYLPVRP